MYHLYQLEAVCIDRIVRRDARFDNPTAAAVTAYIHTYKQYNKIWVDMVD